MRMSGCLELSCTSISSGLPSLFRRTYTRLLLIGLVIYLYLSLFWKLHGVRPQNIQTDFLRPLLDHGRQSLEWTHSDQPIRRYSGDHDLDIDGVYIFKRELGYGYEGSARLYESKDTGEYVVIKTYYSNRFRDQLPDSLSDCFLHKITSWPTEIPAGLLMSAIFTVVPSPDSQTWSHVPMLDYFLAHTGSYFSSPKWHYVTPYIQHGTLVNLSQVAGSRNFVSLASLDQAWRPSFNKLLSTLATLHDAGYCHDDIKPDNVYIANATHWLLGDYGNLREINHQEPVGGLPVE
ncbi:hypothetical protein EJ05DRAFT_487017 [Pseudovirgaria hyperparasitica]|uniref:Protein kinase domain-containing protein n=1 Tax=Pseudovirgaria hyperparasitica TaxID=470096 RepID=A0A6A6W7G2_9PEZI|nr:uncharacterized protein EJ05DRAFT_487017 [Pseudovirgaria hyperparasitica]KAF2757021.1 hypothetical protein EJ05DRAFT_487017 [Pseudovirgaria hyperparasitica]